MILLEETAALYQYLEENGLLNPELIDDSITIALATVMGLSTLVLRDSFSDYDTTEGDEIYNDKKTYSHEEYVDFAMMIMMSPY